MDKIKVNKLYEVNAQASEEFTIDEKILSYKPNEFLIKDSVVAKLAARRSGNHKTKTRAEVSYSTRKLYRQKGTGNARAGSAKSNIRYHGGVTFGPVKRSHEIKINKKEKLLALKSILHIAISSGKVLLFDSLKLENHKTKDFKSALDKWNVEKALIISHEYDENLSLATRNLTNVLNISPSQLNVYDFLSYDKLITTKESLQQIISRLP